MSTYGPTPATHPLAAWFIAVSCVACSAAAEEKPAVPRIAGPWWSIAGNPDLGPLTSDEQEPVDFGIWQAGDGTWQLWSCIRKTKEEGHTRLFFGWEGDELTETDWKPLGIVMRGAPDHGEHPGGLQAPYVVRHDGLWHMFYGDWESICLATSKDGKNFRRASISGAGPQLFSEGEGNKTRDPMLLKVGDTWHCYYCAMPGQGGIFVRRSKSLSNWSKSKPQRVCAGGAPGQKWWNAECPHVVHHEGYFYLFRTSNYKSKPRTTVYRSRDPLDFGVDDDTKIVAALPVAAPEIIFHRGKYCLAALKPQLDGIRIAALEFRAAERDGK